VIELLTPQIEVFGQQAPAAGGGGAVLLGPAVLWSILIGLGVYMHKIRIAHVLLGAVWMFFMLGAGWTVADMIGEGGNAINEVFRALSQISF
jgi:hypothetical protein